MSLPNTPLRIISGGQTGVDLAALDAAITCGLPHGGWVPHDHTNEAGLIPPSYSLTPLPMGGYRQRTRKNVEDSDGTLIIYRNEILGGTLKTANICAQEGKPMLKLDLVRKKTDDFTFLVSSFIATYGIQALNIAGPRASGDPGIYREAYELLVRAFGQPASTESHEFDFNH